MNFGLQSVAMRQEDIARAQGARLAAARFSAGFKSARSAALEFGWPESTYGAHESGRRTIGQDDAEKYARAFRARGAQVDAQKILFGSERDQASFSRSDSDEPSPGLALSVPMPPPGQFVEAVYGGKLQAGSFRDVTDDVDEDRGPQVMPRDRRFPYADYVVFDVVGDSMNAADPPIPDGSEVLAVRTDNYSRPIALRTGDLVVVQRSRAQGGMIERSVKELEMGDDETRYLPRSTNKRHQPIVVRNDPNADDETTVEVLGLVVKVMTDVRRR